MRAIPPELNRLFLAIWSLSLIMMWGCALRIGPMTEDGIYLNANGEVVNAYNGRRGSIVQAGLEALATMGAGILARHDAYRTTIITAEAPDGSPMRLLFTEEGYDLTTLQVRTGRLGFWDHEFSVQVHELLQKRLQKEALAESNDGPAVPSPPEMVLDRTDSADGERPLAMQAPPAVEERKAPAETAARGEKIVSQPVEKTRVSPEEKALPPEPTAPDATIYFEADSNLPGPQEVVKLDQAALRIIADPSLGILLTGYADPSENEGREQLVSESRVLAVKFYLIVKGVDPDRIVAVPPDVTGNGAVGNPVRFRRVEIRLHKTL